MLEEGLGFRERGTSQSQHGAVIDLTRTRQGAKPTLAVKGVKITLEGAETARQGK